jgi:glycoside/pentoside/hexuronide:cation symporter, GPH family
VFGWAGGLAMLMLAFGVFLVPTARYPVGLLNIEGYELYGWAGAALMIAATLVCALSTHRRIAALASSPAIHLPLGESLRKMRQTLANKAFLILLGATLFAFMNTGMAFSTAAYLLTYYWEMPQSGFLAYSVSLFVGVVGAFFLIGFLQSRIEKRTGAVVIGILSLIVAVLPYGLRIAGQFPANNTPMLIPLLFALITVSNGLAVASAILVQSMASDIIEASQERTGERTEGLFFSAYFFTQKCATGLGIFLAGSIVSASQFPAKALPGKVAQTVLDDFASYFLISLVLAALASIACISRFPITRADHEQRLARLAAANGAPPEVP